MQPPSPKVVAETLRGIEAAERPPTHPRRLARTAIKRWRSDASRLKLGVSNQVDSGAPSLRTDEVLAHHHHNQRLGRK